MDGCRKALYNYSWKQSPINKRRRVNPPEEEKKIFDDWFKEKADEYFPCIGDQDPDDEIVYANNSWMTSSPPCNPEMYGTLACISPMILERLQRPKHDQKIVKKEMNKCLANLNRYERSLKETRKTFDLIKKEKRRNLVFFQTEQLSGSVIFPEHSTCIASDEFSSFRKKLYKEQITTRMEGSLSGSKELISKLKSDSILFARRTSCHDTEVCTEQTVSSESKQQTSQHRSDDDSDDELLRLVLESSPIQKSDSTLRVALNEDELSDEALLSMMISSPVSSPKFKSNKWSSAVEITQTLINEMNRVEVQLDHNTRNFIESQRFTNLQISPISVDSGVSTGRNISLNHSADTNLSVGLNSAVRISPTVRNIHENTEDENKENICPNLQDRHADAAIFFSDNLDLLPEQRNNVVNVGNLLRLFSRSILDNEHENHDEHEREASTSPLSVQQRSSLSSSVTSRSPLHWPNFWPQFGSHPITGTPRHSPIRRRTRRLMEEPEFVSLEDLPEVNPFGPNGTPPRTPSRESFVEIRDDFGNRNSNELINEQRESECAVLEIAICCLWYYDRQRNHVVLSVSKKCRTVTVAISVTMLTYVRKRRNVIF
ncbi:Type 2 DNA topoisomerase 6 subunit [Dirofilaria immitis]